MDVAVVVEDVVEADAFFKDDLLLVLGGLARALAMETWKLSSMDV